jgi:hypothetical protein
MDDLLEKIAQLSSYVLEYQIDELEESIEDRGFLDGDRENLSNFRAIENSLDLLYQLIDNSKPLFSYYPTVKEDIKICLDSLEFYLKNEDNNKAIVCAEDLFFMYAGALGCFFDRNEIKKCRKKK